ncbi:MAG: LysE family translocator [Pseudomonadota bacterium]
MLAFAGAIFLMLISPGPGVLTTAGIGSGFGWGPGLRFLIGLFIGTNAVAVLVVSGLITLVPREVEIALLIASCLYFAYLALKIAFAGAKVGFMAADSAPSMWNGITLQFINPKAYAVNTLLFTGWHFWGGGLDEILVKFLIINVVWIPVHLIWLGAGVRIRQLDLPARTQRTINILMALALMGVVLMAAYATL